MERNVTLDFVRGVAILGILLLNISAFGLPKAAYLNPHGTEILPLQMHGLGHSGSVRPVKFLTLLHCCLEQVCKCCCHAASAGFSRV